jgi:type IV pilus assembly protein PilB
MSAQPEVADAQAPAQVHAINRRRQLTDVLLTAGVLTSDQLAEAEAERERTGKDLGRALVDLGFLKKEQLMTVLAESIGWELVDLAEHRIDPAAASLLPEEVALRLLAIPIGFRNDALVVAMANPADLFALDDLGVRTNRKVIPVVAPRADIRTAIRKYVRSGESVEAVASEAALSADDAEMAQLSAAVDEGPIVRMVDSLVAQAIADGASDIHIEPGERDVCIRYRVDGVLHDVTTSPRSILSSLVARVKVMAEMNIAEHQRPQDGRIRLSVGGRPYDLRVATLPTVHGEQVVMRVLDSGSALVRLEELGFPPEAYSAYQEVFTKPYGAILVTGPTGSGKSTTLYSTLHQISSRERAIITVEDPVEYRIPGINQIQVNNKTGLTFAEALRSILRSDPDVILVGEIRDRETAQVAIEAALTGHLVLTTLHTNNAPSSLPRLIEMGVQSYLVASAVEAVVAQRLVRKLCTKCRQGYRPEAVARSTAEGRQCPHRSDQGETRPRDRTAVYRRVCLGPGSRPGRFHPTPGPVRRGIPLPAFVFLPFLALRAFSQPTVVQMHPNALRSRRTLSSRLFHAQRLGKFLPCLCTRVPFLH